MLSLLGPGFDPWLGNCDPTSYTAEPTKQNKHPQAGWLVNKVFIFYKSGGWKVQDQGTGCLGVCWGPTSWFVSLYLQAAKWTSMLSGVPFTGAVMSLMMSSPPTSSVHHFPGGGRG